MVVLGLAQMVYDLTFVTAEMVTYSPGFGL